MARRGARRLVVVAAIACLAGGCSSAPPSKTLEVGHHRLRLTPPPGWEHLDEGRQQLFRNGETALRLEDLGPATRQGLVTELRGAQGLWLAGRRADAFQRVSTLHGPPISFEWWQTRADFWRPWTDVTYIADQADSAQLGIAFHELIREAEALPATSTPNLTEYVLRQSNDADRREVSHRDSLDVHGSKWLVIETWYRLTHQYRRRVAFLDDRGYLLVLSTERDYYEHVSGAFDSLLTSIELTP